MKTRPTVPLSIAALALLLGCLACSPKQPAPPRGLVLIGVDTLRADMLGAYGDPHGLTPELDALAARAVRLADLSAPAPWTLPSFATLFTGLGPETHGAGRRLNQARRLKDVRFSRLPTALPTLTTTLSNAGFATAGFYNNPFLGPSFGFAQGFDEYRYFPAESRGEDTVDAALDWLEKRAAPPDAGRFFAFIHLFDPHTPYRPLEPFCTRVARALEPGFQEQPCKLERPTRGKDIGPGLRPWAEALYRAEVAYTDHQIGRLLRGLDELGLTPGTVVLVTSDHGEAFWERPEMEARGYHEVADHGHTLYQELLRVPGLLAAPGLAPGVVEAPTTLADLFPTLLGLLAVEAPVSEGRNLIPWLRDPSTGNGEVETPSGPPLLGGFLLYGNPRFSARRGPWKLISGPAPGTLLPPRTVLELYRLDEDPGEKHNLSAVEKTITAALLRAARGEQDRRRELRSILLAGETEDIPAEISEEQRQRLRGLGYLQ